MKKFIFTFLAVFLLTVSSNLSVNASSVTVEQKTIEEGTMKFYMPIVKYENKDISDKINAFIIDKNQKIIDEFKEFSSENSIPAERTQLYLNHSVKYNKYDLFSLAVYGFQYTGGAHGITWKNSITINLKTGQEYTLSDLFKKSSDYEKVLNNAIKAQIKERQWEDGVTFTGINADTSFYVTEEVLVIYYQPYEIAPYVFGMLEFYIPIRDLTDIFDDTITIGYL